MPDDPDSGPPTFRADRLRFAGSKTRGRLMPVFKDYLLQFLALSAALVIGVALFGPSFLGAELQSYTSTALGFLTVLIVYVALLCGLWTYYWFRAPAALWQRDRVTKEHLRERLRPRLHLSFNPADCIRDLRYGTISHSRGGNRFHDIKASACNYMIKCSSAVDVEEVSVYVVGVTQKRNGKGAQAKFFAPVKLRPYSDDRESGTETIRIPPTQFFALIKHISRYDRPYIDATMPYEYQFLFDEPGLYDLSIEAKGREVVATTLRLEMCLTTERTAEDFLGDKMTEYDVAWIRELAAGVDERSDNSELEESAGKR